jgi:hypothetical protein
MKGKTTTYILLALVISIWGFVGYSIFKSDETFTIKESDNTEYISKERSILDTLKLDLTYSDPFIDRKVLFNAEKNNRPINKNASFNRRLNLPKKKVVVEKKAFINWPSIKYAGTVNESLGLVMFNGRKIFIKKEDVYDDVHFLNFDSDSLRIKFKEKLRSYPKNKSY